MSRPLRLEFPGAIYHITTRGNAQQPIFLNDQDRKLFLHVLGQTIKAYNALCHAYCLMTNHYHLMIETPDGNLSQVMKQLNGIYTQRFNRRNRRVGHIFQGRFKSIVVDKDSYLLQLCRYIVLNPVRAGMVAHPGEYPWSSYNATSGATNVPELLSTGWILKQFGDHRESAQAEYRRLVVAGIGEESPWNDLKGQCLLGGKKFLEKLVLYLKQKSALKEIPIIDRHLHRPELRELFPADVKSMKRKRNEAIRAAHFEYGFKQKDIADFLGLHYTTLSNILRNTLKLRPDSM